MGPSLKREFANEGPQMAEKHLIRCSTSLAIRKTQIKTTLKFHLTPVRMTMTNNTKDSSCWGGMSKAITHPLLVRPQTCAAITETSVSVPQEAGKWSTLRSSCTMLGHLPQGCLIPPQRHSLNTVHCCSTHSSQKLGYHIPYPRYVHRPASP